MNRSRSLLTAFAALSVALAIAACGSSGKSGNNTASHEAASIQFANCMRAHGIANFPDPSAGGGIQIAAGSGINPFSPSFKDALSACRKLLPGGGPPAHASAQVEELMLQSSQCMRAHGVTGFPDPTHAPPSSPAGYTSIDDRGGVVLAIPNTINEQSPVFKQAAAACKFNG
jgi:hypothetical protein